MRSLPWLSCGLFVVVSLGCGPTSFDCAATCAELEEDISAAQPTLTDPCARPGIVNATTCEECEAAFRDDLGVDPDPGFCG